MESLAQRLQQLRRQKGLSQENLAEQLGVSRQAVGKWESGAAVPELEKLLELCRLLDTDLNTLLGLESRAEQTDADPAQAQPQGFTEEQMALLRQLIREGRQAAPPPPPVQKRRKWPWLLVAAAVVIGGISQRMVRTAAAAAVESAGAGRQHPAADRHPAKRHWQH